MGVLRKKRDGRIGTVTAPWKGMIAEALKSGPKDTLQLREITGYAGIGRVCGEMVVERKVRRAGEVPRGKRPVILWALVV